MSRLRVILCRVEDEDPDKMVELASFDLPSNEIDTLRPETALDTLEQQTAEVGNDLLRKALEAQWEQIDTQLTQKARQDFSPQRVQSDGSKALKVATRFGVLFLKRNILSAASQAGTQKHHLPGNNALPEHDGMLITRGLQEWACLLPQQLSFASATRLLGWQAQEEDAVLATTTLRNLVKEHGQILRKAEIAEAETLIARLKQAGGEAPTPRLLSAPRLPHRRPGWPAELSASVEAALNASSDTPPRGVSQADWERVLCVRREETQASVRELRLLGPQVGEGEVLVTTDEVLTRRPQKRRFIELRTARILTAQGSRYLSGTGASFLVVLTAFVLLCAQTNPSVLVLADGARWIRNWFCEVSGSLLHSQLLLDWFHLCKKCRELSSMICRGRKAKALFLKPLLRALWAGQLPTALSLLEGYRSEAKNVEKLDELLQYLRDRQPYLAHYAERRRQRQYIGSGPVEKANDLIVAQRQKGQGMHWSETTSDSLAALRTLMLNGGWDRYWLDREVLPLAV